jgi:hypothetical protein
MGFGIGFSTQICTIKFTFARKAAFFFYLTAYFAELVENQVAGNIFPFALAFSKKSTTNY